MRDTGGFFISLQRRQVRIAATVEANDGEVKATVGTENLTIALGVGPDSQPCSPYRKCIEKLTSMDHFSTLVQRVILILSPRPCDRRPPLSKDVDLAGWAAYARFPRR